MKTLWLCPPSKIPGEYPLVGQNRWFKYLPTATNFIYPVISAYGITMIRKAGFGITFIDAPAENVTLEKLKEIIPEYDLLIMEGRTAVMKWLWELTKVFKHFNPRLKVALYGDHVIVRPGESLDHGVDFIINCGDYDYGAFMLVSAIENREPPNKILSVPLMENLDELPFIDRKLVPWKNYFESWRHRDKFGWFQSGRGCWAACTFCSWVYTFYGHTIRTMSAKRIANEVEYASQRYGIEEYLDDADTFLPKQFGVPFAEEMKNRKLEVLWNAQTRADTVMTVGEKDWKFMRDNGLRIIKLGVDGGSDYTLERIKKGYNVETVKAAVKRLKKSGVEVHVNMIIGWPWETKKQAYDVIKFVKKLKPNQAQFSLIEPFPGTPIFDEAIKNNWFAKDPYDWDSYSMKHPILKGEVNPEEISKLHKDAWESFYFDPGFVASQILKSTKLTFKERNFDSFRHLWRGYKGVKDGHSKAVTAE